jgi:spartin
MEKGAVKATQLIEYVSEKQKAKIQPAEKEAKVNPAIRTSITGAKYATKATVKVSGFVAKRVGKLSKGLSNYLATKMEPTVTGTLPSGSGGDGKPKSSSMYNLVDAARGGLLAYGTVYESLEQSGKVLGSSVKANTVTVVEKKYGNEASQVYGEALTAAGDAAMTYMNIQSLGIKGLAKKTAKDTGKQLGKAVLQTYSKDAPSSTEQQK